MRHTQIVGQQDVILRVVYEWNTDEEMIDEIVSIDIEEGNIAPLLDEDIYEDIVDELYSLHNEELPDT